MRSTFIRIAAISLGGWWIVLPVLSYAQPEPPRKRNRLSHYFESPAQQVPNGAASKNIQIAQNEWQSEMQPSMPVPEPKPRAEEVTRTNETLNTVKTGPVPPPAVKNTKDDAIQPPSQGTIDESFDVEAKKKDVIQLVEQGVAYLQSHPPHEAFQAFVRDKKFKKGELYLFAFDTSGICFAHGEEESLVWQNLYNIRGSYGSYIVQDIIKKGQQGGGWFTYRWRNATQIAYLLPATTPDGKTYIIGSGYYPHSKRDSVINLVKSAVSLFNTAVKENRSKDEVLSLLSWPLGKFVFGDLYVYALDFHGMQFAHGELPGLIGISAWDYQDADGRYINQEIVKKLKEVGSGGISIEYKSKNALKWTYAEKVVDGEGKEYFIACGYYPQTTMTEVQNLVRRGYEFMKKTGASRAFTEFNDPFSKEFRYGDLYLFVYDKKGLLKANGSNPALVGQNNWNLQDDSGSYYVQALIKKAEQGGGQVEAKTKGSFQSFYVIEVNLGVETYIIGSSVYPISKEETMLFMAKSGASYLNTHEPEEAFKEFVTKDGKFIRGDMSVFAIDAQGICYAWGDDYDIIWRNLMNLKDDHGKPYIQMFINTAKNGAETVTYTLNGKTHKVRLEPVNKNGVFYVVGSEFVL
jgi:signal transduction histidine kinase